jgi:hypothetical protein
MQPFSKTFPLKGIDVEVKLLFEAAYQVDASQGGEATLTATLDTGNSVRWANLGLEPPSLPKSQTVIPINSGDTDQLIQQFIAETEAKLKKLLSGLDTKASTGKDFLKDLARCFEAKGYTDKVI